MSGCTAFEIKIDPYFVSRYKDAKWLYYKIVDCPEGTTFARKTAKCISKAEAEDKDKKDDKKTTDKKDDKKTTDDKSKTSSDKTKK